MELTSDATDFRDVRQTADDGTLVRRALAAGLQPTALSSLALGHDCGQGLLLSFTNVAEGEARRLVETLAAAISNIPPPLAGGG